MVPPVEKLVLMALRLIPNDTEAGRKQTQQRADCSERNSNSFVKLPYVRGVFIMCQTLFEQSPLPWRSANEACGCCH